MGVRISSLRSETTVAAERASGRGRGLCLGPADPAVLGGSTGLSGGGVWEEVSCCLTAGGSCRLRGPLKDLACQRLHGRRVCSKSLARAVGGAAEAGSDLHPDRTAYWCGRCLLCPECPALHGHGCSQRTVPCGRGPMGWSPQSSLQMGDFVNHFLRNKLVGT